MPVHWAAESVSIPRRYSERRAAVHFDSPDFCEPIARNMDPKPPASNKINIRNVSATRRVLPVITGLGAVPRRKPPVALGLGCEHAVSSCLCFFPPYEKRRALQPAPTISHADRTDSAALHCTALQPCTLGFPIRAHLSLRIVSAATQAVSRDVSCRVQGLQTGGLRPAGLGHPAATVGFRQECPACACVCVRA